MTLLALLLRTRCRFRTSLRGRPLLCRRLWCCSALRHIRCRPTLVHIGCTPPFADVGSAPPLVDIRSCTTFARVWRWTTIEGSVARVRIPYRTAFWRTWHVTWSSCFGLNGLSLIVIYFRLAIEYRRSAILGSRRLIVIRRRTWNRPLQRARCTVVIRVLPRRVRCRRTFRIHSRTAITRRPWYIPLG